MLPNLYVGYFLFQKYPTLAHTSTLDSVPRLKLCGVIYSVKLFSLMN